MKYFTYNLTTNKVTGIGNSNVIVTAPGEGYVELADDDPLSDGSPDDVYTDGLTLSARSEFLGSFDKNTIIANGIDIATLAGLPIPCEITIDGVTTVQVLDGSFEFAADSPGSYRINLGLNNPPLAKKEWIINAD